MKTIYNRLQSFVAPLKNGKMEKIWVTVLGFWVLLIIIKEIFFNNWYFQKWDFLFITTYLIFFMIIFLAVRIPEEFRLTLDQLMKRGVLKLNLDEKHLDLFLRQRENTWGRPCGVVLGIIFLIIDLKANGFGFDVFNLIVNLVDMISAFWVGYYLGVIGLYITFFLLPESKVSIKVYPGFMDQAAGLRPLGEFYFKKALLFFVP